MHYSLGQVKQAHEGDPYPVGAVLKGDEFQPPFRGLFSYPMHELETVMALHSLKSNGQN